MARLFDGNQEYELTLKVNKDEVLKDIREIKKETESIIKDAEFSINKLRLKRKDILVVKFNIFLKSSDKDKIAKQLKKKLHRKVLVLDKIVEDIRVLEK